MELNGGKQFARRNKKEYFTVCKDKQETKEFTVKALEISPKRNVAYLTLDKAATQDVGLQVQMQADAFATDDVQSEHINKPTTAQGVKNIEIFGWQDPQVGQVPVKHTDVTVKDDGVYTVSEIQWKEKATSSPNRRKGFTNMQSPTFAQGKAYQEIITVRAMGENLFHTQAMQQNIRIGTNQAGYDYKPCKGSVAMGSTSGVKSITATVTYGKIAPKSVVFWRKMSS